MVNTRIDESHGIRMGVQENKTQSGVIQLVGIKDGISKASVRVCAG